MKPCTLLTQRKEINGLLESPLSSPEVSLLITEDIKGGKRRSTAAIVEILRYYYDVNFNSACCRLLIFWSLITTLSSIVSIYYAIDAQNRLNEATDNLNLLNGLENSSLAGSFKEPRYHDLAHRFAPFVERASAARRHRHHHHRHKKPKSQQTDSKIKANNKAESKSKRSTANKKQIEIDQKSLK